MDVVSENDAAPSERPTLMLSSSSREHQQQSAGEKKEGVKEEDPEPRELTSAAISFATNGFALTELLQRISAAVDGLEAVHVLYDIDAAVIGPDDEMIGSCAPLKPIPSTPLVTAPSVLAFLSKPSVVAFCGVCSILGLFVANVTPLWKDGQDGLTATSLALMLLASPQIARYRRQRIKLLTHSFDFWYQWAMMFLFLIVTTTLFISLGVHPGLMVPMSVVWGIVSVFMFFMTDASDFSIPTRVRLMFVSVVFFVGLMVTANRFTIGLYGEETEDILSESIDFHVFTTTLNALLYSATTPLALFVVRYSIMAAYFKRPFNLIAVAVRSATWADSRVLDVEPLDVGALTEFFEALDGPADAGSVVSNPFSSPPADGGGRTKTMVFDLDSPESEGMGGQQALSILIEDAEMVSSLPPKKVTSPPSNGTHGSSSAVTISDDSSNVEAGPRQQKSSIRPVNSISSWSVNSGKTPIEVAAGEYLSVSLVFTTPLPVDDVTAALHVLVRAANGRFVQHSVQRYTFGPGDEVLGGCESAVPVSTLPIVNHKMVQEVLSGMPALIVCAVLALVGTAILVGAPWISWMSITTSTAVGSSLMLVGVGAQFARYKRGYLRRMLTDFQFWYIMINAVGFMVVAILAYHREGLPVGLGALAAIAFLFVVYVILSVDAAPFPHTVRNVFIVLLFLFFATWSISMANFVVSHIWSASVAELYKTIYEIGPVNSTPSSIAISCGIGAALYLLKFMVRLRHEDLEVVYTTSPLMDATSSKLSPLEYDDLLEEPAEDGEDQEQPELGQHAPQESGSFMMVMSSGTFLRAPKKRRAGSILDNCTNKFFGHGQRLSLRQSVVDIKGRERSLSATSNASRSPSQSKRCSRRPSASSRSSSRAAAEPELQQRNDTEVVDL